MRGRDVRATVRRVRIARVLLFLPFLVLTARAAHLGVVDRRGAERGVAQTQRTLTLMPVVSPLRFETVHCTSNSWPMRTRSSVTTEMTCKSGRAEGRTASGVTIVLLPSC